MARGALIRHWRDIRISRDVQAGAHWQRAARSRGVQAVLADPEGQRWLVTSHVRDTDPSDWYGTVLGPMPG